MFSQFFERHVKRSGESCRLEIQLLGRISATENQGEGRTTRDCEANWSFRGVLQLGCGGDAESRADQSSNVSPPQAGSRWLRIAGDNGSGGGVPRRRRSMASNPSSRPSGRRSTCSMHMIRDGASGSGNVRHELKKTGPTSGRIGGHAGAKNLHGGRDFSLRFHRAALGFQSAVSLAHAP